MKIFLIYGGTASEKEVSVRGGKRIAEALRFNNYEVEELNLDNYQRLIDNVEKIKNSDLVFIALHGTDGESGKVQGFLDTLNVKYIGSDLLASSICFNKEITFELVKEIVDIPEWKILKKEEKNNPLNRFPVILKPISEGSSVDVEICDTPEDYSNKLDNFYKKYDELIVQEFIIGKEITIPMIEKNGKIVILPILEIKPENRFYDYEAKYTEGKTKFIVPARINDEIREEIVKKSEKIFEKLNCKDFARIDGIIKDEKFYFFEVNTIPGLTELSDLPISAMAKGIDFNNLINGIVFEAVNRTED